MIRQRQTNLRRTLLRLILLVMVALIAAGATYWYLKLRKPAPTPFDWKAHTTTIFGDGSPNVLSDPFGVVIDSNGTVFVSDAGDTNQIRKLTKDGTVVTFAGSSEGFSDGTPGSFNTPSGLAIDIDDNVYVADTGNNRIRKITPQGVVSTIAGSGTAGFLDGPAANAQFDGPVGVAVDENSNVYVADTYNDRIRKISVDGVVSTIAGGPKPGFADGDATAALFDTPCGLVVTKDGSLIVADTGNRSLRKVSPTGQVTTLTVSTELRAPIGLAITHDGFVYVTDFDRSTVVQIAPDGNSAIIVANGPGYADGPSDIAALNHPSGVALDPNSRELLVADSSNYLLRKLSPTAAKETPNPIQGSIPRLTIDSLKTPNLLWPLDPQDKPHEVVATMGEVRGSFDSTDSRDHLHSGLDVGGAYGDFVRTIRNEKVNAPLPNWGLDNLSEGIRVGIVSYIHMQVGRDKDSKMFNDPRFVALRNQEGKIERIRVRRGTRFKVGDTIGTVNKMYHVHLIVGPYGGVANPLSLSPVGFKDSIAPIIEKDGIQLFDESGKRFAEKEKNRTLVTGKVRIVVDAFDRSDMNPDRRRLGLYSLGYQVLDASGSPAKGFGEPQITIVFDRLPLGDEVTKVVYAAESGITVYGSKTTRFLYEVTNTVRDGHARTGRWDTSELSKGDYVLRIFTADFSGNKTQQDIPLTIK